MFSLSVMPSAFKYILLHSFVELRADFCTSNHLRGSGKNMHIFTSRQSGDIRTLPRFEVRRSAVEPHVEESCYRGAKSLLATALWKR